MIGKQRKVYKCPYTINTLCSMEMPCVECDDFKGIEDDYLMTSKDHFEAARKIVESWPDWKKECKI